MTHPRSRITVNNFRRGGYGVRYRNNPRSLYYRSFSRPYRSRFYAYRPGFHLYFGYPRFGYPYYGFRRYNYFNYGWPIYNRIYNFNSYCDPGLGWGLNDVNYGFNLALSGNIPNYGHPATYGLLGNALSNHQPVLSRLDSPGVERVLAEHREKSAIRGPKVMETPEELLTAAIVETNLRKPPSNLTARRRCRESMTVGDRLFAEGKYADALNRYKRAASYAPDIAEAFFRQGHAYLASARVKLAAKAFQRGFDVNPDIARDGFKLTELYSKKQPVTKKNHFDELARLALKDPTRAEPYLLIGLMLHYGGEQVRAEKFFRQAEKAQVKYRFATLFLPRQKAAGKDL